MWHFSQAHSKLNLWIHFKMRWIIKQGLIQALVAPERYQATLSHETLYIRNIAGIDKSVILYGNWIKWSESFLLTCSFSLLFSYLVKNETIPAIRNNKSTILELNLEIHQRHILEGMLENVLNSDITLTNINSNKILHYPFLLRVTSIRVCHPALPYLPSFWLPTLREYSIGNIRIEKNGNPFLWCLEKRS